jgi:hypothetical protein
LSCKTKAFHNKVYRFETIGGIDEGVCGGILSSYLIFLVGLANAQEIDMHRFYLDYPNSEEYVEE